MRRLGCLPLLLFLTLSVALPFFFANLFTSALVKLGLGRTTAVALIALIVAGSLINIPVRRILRYRPVRYDPFAVFGLPAFSGRFARSRSEIVVAVNVGGCVVPSLIALYQIGRIMQSGWPTMGALAIAVPLNVGVCYWTARPVEGAGIMMPALVPALVAAICALTLAPDQATPVAFVAGVTGPIIGADILHLNKIEQVSTGLVSVGGAGTFDGIVLSGIIAAYLAG